MKDEAIYDRNGNRIPYIILAMNDEWELITPKIASDFLETMNKNRSLRKRTVDKYKTDLKNGDFNICFDSPIIFNENGEMVNGQHRCVAIKDSGIPCWCKVFNGVPNDAVIDNGLLRSTGDSLWMRGIIPDNMKSTKISAIVRSYLKAKGCSDVSRITTTEIGDFLNEYGEMVVKAFRLSCKGINRRNVVADKSGVQAALFAAIMCGVSEDGLEEMMTVVNTGFMSSQFESPAIVLRNRLLNYKSSSEIIDVCSATEQAIYDFVHHNQRTRQYKTIKHPYVNMCTADIKKAAREHGMKTEDEHGRFK